MSKNNDAERHEEAWQSAMLRQPDITLPDYASAPFWQIIQSPTFPLEALVHYLRMALARKDSEGQHRIFEYIVLRTKLDNEIWAGKVLRNIVVTTDERHAFISDLCADLYESLLRALLDPQRLFWEKNFWHCLHFERQHIYQSFLMREGRWRDRHVQRSTRIPRERMVRLDMLLQREVQAGDNTFFEDEQAQKLLSSVEECDLLQFVLLLPDKLKIVILLIFWEERTQKDTARILGISDRTVRNHIRAAAKLLREAIILERELTYV